MNSNEKCVVGKFFEFLGIKSLTNIHFQRNMSIIYFCFPFWSGKEILGGHFSTYQGKLDEPGVMDIINDNQQKF